MPRARAFGRQSRVVARACVRAPEPLAASAALAPEAPEEEDACVRPAASPRRQASRCRLNPPSRRCRRGRGPTRTSATAAARLASGHKPARSRAALPGHSPRGWAAVAAAQAGVVATGPAWRGRGPGSGLRRPVLGTEWTEGWAGVPRRQRGTSGGTEDTELTGRRRHPHSRPYKCLVLRLLPVGAG